MAVELGTRASVTIEATMAVPFTPTWNRVPGVEVSGHQLRIEPDDYFFRYGSPSWRVCDWELVEREVLAARETSESSIEQIVLDFIRKNGRSTSDPTDVLHIAEQMYSYLFRDDYLAEPDLKAMGVTHRHLTMLREMGIVMALNKVELTGNISIVGPAWFFPVCSEVVYGLSEQEGRELDELYHGTFFNETRRVDSVKAHAALGGRLVHGCHSGGCLSGGCVLSYGTSVDRFSKDLSTFKAEWMDRIRAAQ